MKMKRTGPLEGQSRSWQAWVVAAFLLLLPRLVHAEQKTYMGASCMPIASQDRGYFQAENGGVIRNNDAFDHQVVCPIVKTVPGQGAIEKLDVFVDLGSTTSSVTCTLSVIDATMTPTGPTSLALPTGSYSKTVTGVGSQAMPEITSASQALPAAWSTATWSYYQMNCKLDAGAAIKSYFVQEAGTQTDAKKTFPPSMCRAAEFSTSSNWLLGSWFAPRAASGVPGSALAVCPIITDRMANTGGAVIDASFGPPDNAAYTSYCAAYAAGNNGLTTDSAGYTVVGGHEFQGVIHSFDLHTTPTWARYYLTCNMNGTGDSKILSYRIAERTAQAADPTAADGKVFPGAWCTGAPYSSNVMHNSDGSAYNASGVDYASAYCPVMADRFGVTTGLSRARAYITRSNGQANATYCVTYSYSAAGSAPFSSAMGHTSSPPSGSVDEQVNMPLSSSPSDARYYILCNLAPHSVFNEYEIEER